MTKRYTIDLRKLFLLGVAWLVVAASIQGQVLHADGARPSFEVTSVKPSTAAFGPQIPPGAGRFLMRAATVEDMVMYAYGLRHRSEFAGGPGWVKSERFDVEGRLSDTDMAAVDKLPGPQREEQMAQRLQTLLADRFALKVSFPKKELPVFELTVAKDGFKCAKAAPPQNVFPAVMPRFALLVPPPVPVPPGLSPEQQHALSLSPHVTMKGWPMWTITNFLRFPVEMQGRMVVDKTGIEGNYDCDLQWVSEGADVPGPSLYTALEEQMGLHLRAAKEMLETVMVESVERPTGN